MKSKQSFKFPHELSQTPETKIPKYTVKYSAKKKKALTSVATQTSAPTDGQVLGEMPARVYSSNTYTPLVNPIILPKISKSTQVDFQTQGIGTQADFQTQEMGTQADFQTQEMGTQVNLPPTEADITYFIDSIRQEFEQRVNDMQSAITSAELQTTQAQVGAYFNRLFIDTFFYYLGIPEEMKIELDSILDNLKRAELTKDNQGNVIIDTNSEYNAMVYGNLNNWLASARDQLKARDFIPLVSVKDVMTQTNPIVKNTPPPLVPKKRPGDPYFFLLQYPRNVKPKT